MPKRAFQITGDQPGLSVLAPTLFQAEADFLAFQRQRRTEARQRKELDYESGALAYAAYEKSLTEDLAQFNPDAPEYGDVYARLIKVREQRQRMQDQDMIDKFERGILESKDIQSYFERRLEETATDTPEFFGLTGSQRQAFLIDLQRQAEFANAEFSEGAIGLSEYVSRLKEISQSGGFVENSPVAIGLRSKIRSSELQAELDALAEEFELAQGEELLGLADRLNEIKGRFSQGSDVRRSIFGAKQDVLQTAYGQFAQQEAAAFSSIFGEATGQVRLAEEFGLGDAIKGQELLFGLARDRAERGPISLREFAEQRPSLDERLTPFRETARQIREASPTFEDIRDAQKQAERERVSAGSLLKPFEGF